MPSDRLRIAAIGPLELQRDGLVVGSPDLRRRRVRELLCYLVARPRVRREEAAEELWPELEDAGRNLRVTLSYVQRLLQPGRANDERPYFLRTDATWLTLGPAMHLEVDVWELGERLDEADVAERAANPAVALAAYRAVLPLWRGEPFADVPYAEWAQAERTRYAAGAIRGGELLSAAGELKDARGAAESAITAEPWSEAAYRLLARAHMAMNDPAAARRTIDAALLSRNSTSSRKRRHSRC